MKKEYRGITWDGTVKGLCRALKVQVPMYLLFKTRIPGATQESFIDCHLDGFPESASELVKIQQLKREMNAMYSDIDPILRKDALTYLAIRERDKGSEYELVVRNLCLIEVGLNENELKDRIVSYFHQKGSDVSAYDLRDLCVEIVGII